MKQGDRIRATNGENVIVGKVTRVSGWDNKTMTVQVDNIGPFLLVLKDWKIEVLVPEVPEGFKKQGAKIADANDQHWYLFSHTENLWMSADGEDEILHWNYLAKPVHLLEVVATYPPES